MAKAAVKIRAKEKSGVVTIKVLMTHPMETGLRKDKNTGKIIPAFYIENVSCSSAGNPLMNCNWSGSVSKNPYLSFKFDGKKGDEFSLTWRDNKGGTGTETSKVR